MRTLVIVLASCLVLGLSYVGAAPVVQTNRVAEVAFSAVREHADPFNEIELDVVVSAPSGSEMRVPAFWAGGKSWRVRYASPEIGTHRYKTVCSDTTDAGLHGVEGSVEITRYEGKNPLYLHGPIRVASDNKHFEHRDGTPFFWLGDTWWMGLTDRLHWPDEFAALTKDRVDKGFTVVQIVAGLYPDMPAFDQRGANEAGFPWEKNYARINPEYFDYADRRIAYMADNGLAPCVVGAWGYHLPWLGAEKMKKHWRYIIARWGAYPTFWCVAGEGAMPYYLSADKPKEAELQKQGWTEIARYLRATDPFHRPISIHPTDRSRNQVTDPAVLDFEMLQTGHGDRASLANTIFQLQTSRSTKPAMPTINSEVCYEGILGTCHDDVQRLMGWTSLLAGTAGHTYGANGIWQMNRKDQPYGKSPHGGTYGPTPWDEAMLLPGSGQTALAKKLLERFEWWKFEPHPEWASWDELKERPKVVWGQWIWNAGDGDAPRGAPVEKRWFRKVVHVPADAHIERASLAISVDDRFTMWFNGEKLGGQRGWESPKSFDITKRLKVGPNVLAIEAENVSSQVTSNPAGFICGGEIALGGGATIPIKSDSSWKSSRTAPADESWTKLAFDDSGWTSAKVNADYGGGPWGRFGDQSGALPIAAAGIRDVVRVIYVPSPRPVRLHGLTRGAPYKAEWFDPVHGASESLGALTIADDGCAVVPPPENADDWVLVILMP